MSERLEGKTPWEFACGWYTPDEIERCIANRHRTGFGEPNSRAIPSDIESRAFAEWLCHQYRLAMNKGITIGLSAHAARDVKLRELVDEWRRASVVERSRMQYARDDAEEYQFQCAADAHDFRANELDAILNPAAGPTEGT